jgi:hypothetical protein
LFPIALVFVRAQVLLKKSKIQGFSGFLGKKGSIMVNFHICRPNNATVKYATTIAAANNVTFEGLKSKKIKAW